MNSNPDNPGYPKTQEWLTYQYQFSTVNTQCEDWDREYVLNKFKNTTNGVFVEIGVFGGATLLHLYEHAKENNNIIYGIDPHDKINIYNGVSSEETDEEAKEYTKNLFSTNRENLQNIIKKYKLEDHIKYINDFSSNACTLFEDNYIDVLHIDGDHSTKGIYDDLVNYYPKMKNGGVIICDDYNWPSLAKGIHLFLDKYKLQGQPTNGRKFTIIK
jgi:hypothetical protein